MATRTIVQIEDDLTGGAADESVAFGLDGKQFEIDLNEANANKLREAIAPYIAAGRSVRSSQGSRAGGKRAGTGNSSDADPATIRAWAQENGHPVSSRGRVSRELREAYANANG